MEGDYLVTRRAQQIVEQIRPALAGMPPHVQGTVLAMMMDMWVSGHVVVGDEEATVELRREILAEHYRAVQMLVALSEPR